jgi:hypothetical protein
MSTFKNWVIIKYHEMQTSLQKDYESDSPNQQCVWSKKHIYIYSKKHVKISELYIFLQSNTI